MEERDIQHSSRIAALISGYLLGKLNMPEVAELEDWINTSAGNEEIFRSVLNETILEQQGRLYHAIDTQMALQSAKKGLTFNNKATKVRRLFTRSGIAAAAAVLLIISAGILFFRPQLIPGSGHPELASGLHDIKPGDNKAYLTLGNGKRIALTDAHSGELAKEDGVSITKTEDGQLVYSLSGDADGNSDYNTIETPKGGQHQLRLPDGTSVWLNASTILKYPANIAALKERRVSLVGEAYFQVAKDAKHPFIVETEKQDIEVLGTHFNVNAYRDEAAAKTTLLEGSVRVSSGGNVKVIKPDQQAVSSGGEIEVKDVDAEFAVAWKNGFFMFNSENLDQVMRRISRWYDVRVVYEDPELKSKTFVGTISRFENISKVLNMLERTNTATFTIKENTITIKKK